MAWAIGAVHHGLLGIWKNRNDLRMGGKGRAGRTVLRNAMHLVEEFRATNDGKIEH